METNKKLPLGAIACFGVAAVEFLTLIINLFRGGFSALTLFIALGFAAVGVAAFMRNKAFLAGAVGALTLILFAQLILSKGALAVFSNLFAFLAAAVLLFIVLTKLIPNFDPLKQYMNYVKFCPAALYALSAVLTILYLIINIFRLLRWHYGVGWLILSFFLTLIVSALVLAAFYFIAADVLADPAAEGAEGADPAASLSGLFKSKTADGAAKPAAAPRPAAPRAASGPLNPANNPYLRNNAAAAAVAAAAAPEAPAAPAAPAAPEAPAYQPYVVVTPEAPVAEAAAEAVEAAPAAAEEAVEEAVEAAAEAVEEIPAVEMPVVEMPAAEEAVAAAEEAVEEAPAAVEEAAEEAAETVETAAEEVAETAETAAEEAVETVEAAAREAAEAPAEAAAQINNDSIALLNQLKGLLDSGVLTQEEFDAKKKQILGL